MRKNRELVLRKRIETTPTIDDFELIDREVPDTPPAGMLLVHNYFLSMDPYLGQALRGRHMGEPHPDAGDRLPGLSISEVIASNDARFQAGDHVVGQAGWSSFGLMPAESARRVDPSLGLAEHLGLLGSPGLTAWAGVTQLAKVQAGDIFSVDAAAGAVGGAAGQIAKILGARAIGIAGGAEKCALVRDRYRFDACVDYRDPNFLAQYLSATDGGPTVHFENVGLAILTPVLQNLKHYGRIVLCGLAQHYHDDTGERPSLPIGAIMMKRALVHGLIVYDFNSRLDEYVAFAAPHIAAGRLVEHNDISIGLESAPTQLARLIAGRNIGKSLVQIAD